ncbi:unnamed protein product [Plutella xylostella]|uniref:(diamondback moth) hypothetical protein n=1 Tax=Plutella xylostella TaxID=51655 RepID=A0A8S4D7V6_PLUXY|nr:unnamed protein product [Plutella xylostella]
MKKKLELEHGAPCGVLTAYRERGNYLQRLEQFEKAIQSYDEALAWHNNDVRSLLGRSVARAKATQYSGALQDVARAIELDPDNITAKQIRAQTEYEKCSFERSLVLAHRGKRLRRFPPDFAECARHAEETIRECAGKSASGMMKLAIPLLKNMEMRSASDTGVAHAQRRSRVPAHTTHEVQEVSYTDQQKLRQTSRRMACKYLGRMAHDRHFLDGLCGDERLASANKRGSELLLELARKGAADLGKRQEVLRERRPMYAAEAAESAARARLSNKRQEHLTRTQKQHTTNAKRLLQTAEKVLEQRDTAKCLENAEFAMEQIARIPARLLPRKEKFMQELYRIVATAFLDQKRVGSEMSESSRECRAFVLLGLGVSREPSRDSVLQARPPPPRDAKRRLTTLERRWAAARGAERCYVAHELARLHLDLKQPQRARYYAYKCRADARAANQRLWLLNAAFVFARCNIQLNNRNEAKAALLEAAGWARQFGYSDVSAFLDTCATVSTEGEVEAEEEPLQRREKAMVSLMQDDDLKSAAKHLFKRMSMVPTTRRFSVMPGQRSVDTGATGAAGAAGATSRRVSIMPNVKPPTTVTQNKKTVVGFQDFDV